MTTTTATPTRPVATALRSLYLTRFGFAIVWAVLFALTASSLNAVSVTLLLIYPLFDVGAAVVDHRASQTDRRSPLLVINMILSLLATIGLIFAVTSGKPAVLGVWGAWAITAGAVQLAVALARRSMGGQTPMILSGGISVLVGAMFLVQAAQSGDSLAAIAGYAAVGGIFFLLSALRLGRADGSVTR